MLIIDGRYVKEMKEIYMYYLMTHQFSGGFRWMSSRDDDKCNTWQSCCKAKTQPTTDWSSNTKIKSEISHLNTEQSLYKYPINKINNSKIW